MINFFSENKFELKKREIYVIWLKRVVSSEGKELGDLNYIFVDDTYLHDLNTNYLDHDTLTDIISFDYCDDNQLGGDIFISIDRVRDNALKFEVGFEEELRRVMAHGILHFCGYQDKTDALKEVMRDKENEKMKLFHVEQR